MSRLLTFIVLCAALQSCKTYNYYPPSVNAPVFRNKGEVQVAGGFAVSGFSGKGGVAITDNISVAGQYNSAPGIDDYYGKESEVAGGWNTRNSGEGVFSIFGGYGWGGNYHQDSGSTIKSFRGDFQKPFLIVSYGSARGSLGKHVKVDGQAALKFNYFMYSGYKTAQDTGGKYVDNAFNAENFFWEPYLGGNIGGKHVRFELGTGFSIKRLVEINKGARIFPMHMYFALRVILGRKYEDAKPPGGGE